MPQDNGAVCRRRGEAAIRGDIAIAMMALCCGSNSCARTMPHSSLAPTLVRGTNC